MSRAGSRQIIAHVWHNHHWRHVRGSRESARYSGNNFWRVAVLDFACMWQFSAL